MISLDVKSFDRHGFPWLQSTKHIYNIDNNIYKKSTFLFPPWVFTKNESCKPPHPSASSSSSSQNSSSCFPLGSPSPTVQSQPNCSSCVCCDWAQEQLINCSPLQLPTMCNGSSPLFPSTPASTRDQKFSDHERILILQLFKFFDLLSQKQYPVGETDTTAALSVCTWIEVFFECWD